MNKVKISNLLDLLCRLIIVIVFSISIIIGCAKEHRLRPIQFKPHPPSEIPEKELPPIPTASPVQSLRVAGAYFNEAKEALKKGDKKTAQEKYVTVRRTLINAGIVPGIFQELNNFWEVEMLPATERSISFESMNTYKIIDGLKATPPYKSIEIPFPVPERVLYEIEDAQTRYPDRFQEGLDRSGYYVPHLKNALKQAGLPQELCWVAMVESMYKLKAYSSAGAAGMWQFIRSTGSHYNLRIDSYVDERYNWRIATSAAINYMKNLHDFFNGSWELAISAYNMGEGGLLRAIEANGGDRNFWTLTETPPACYRIKEETKKYYPRFLAYILICNDPTPYGFTPSSYSPIQWDEIEIKGMYALDTLDSVMNYKPGTLSTWNPHLIRGVTPPQGCKLMLPAGDGVKLAKVLDDPSLKRTEFIAYTVKKGESAYQIARKHGISVDELLKVNGFSSVKSIKTGVTLQVPMSNYKVVNFAKHHEESEDIKKKDLDYHTVKQGETLYHIAKKYDIPLNDLAVWNNITGDRRLKVDEKIRLKPQTEQGVSFASNSTTNNTSKDKESSTQQMIKKNVYYTVKNGDTISSIAKQYSVKPEKIMELNNLSNRSILKIGQKLIVKQETAQMETKKPQSEYAKVQESNMEVKTTKLENKVYTVKQGDTLSKIAKENNVSLQSLLEWNNLDTKSQLKIGQKILLSKNTEMNNKTDTVKVVNEDKVDGTSKGKLDENKTNKSVMGTIEHTIQSGESLWLIAKKYNIPSEKILECNPQINPKSLKVGMKLSIPASSLSTPYESNVSNSSKVEKKEKEPNTSHNEVEQMQVAKSEIYKVQPGDSLWSIAQKNNVSVSDIMTWNNLEPTSKLKIGQELKIKSTKSSQNILNTASVKPKRQRVESERTETANEPKSNIYIVGKGDSLYTISKKTGVPVKKLMEINKIDEKKVLQIGEKILISN